ncbi:MAG: glutamate--tRNA ligase [Bacteroidetes bacterium]|nr:glutamate--tRNA ligase [Bacteroidota bacterium]MBL6943953.1 glutamate--tRNA ligase [Bacteroidales bacterium]
MSNSNIRVRFAPSPTGPLHIGGVRTALYNYLFARKNGGKFILRIEDTDQTRLVSGAEKYIIDSFKWCGIEFDEGVASGGDYGPYRQSDRKHIYPAYAEELVKSGHAYYAFDTPDELNKIRTDYELQKLTFVYNAVARKKLRNSLTLTEEETNKLLESGEPYVIRFCMPENKIVVMNDMIRGKVEVNTSALDDKVLFKSDGMPTYHLANIVDDHLMEISHVIRGEEWLPSLPLHVLLYEAFNWEKPEFAHLPLLLKPDGNGKLSKRDGDRLGFPVFPLEWKDPKTGNISTGFREEGYFADAFINLLAMLGWNPGDERELFSMEELTEAFSIERVGKSGAKFDPVKAAWFNHQYLIRVDNETLAGLLMPIAIKNGVLVEKEQLSIAVGMVKERVNFVSELWDHLDFFFKQPENYDHKSVKKCWKEGSYNQMAELKDVLLEVDDFTAENTEKAVKKWIENNEYKTGAVMNAFRLLLVGELKGPHLFDIVALIGQEASVERIEQGLHEIGRIEN